MPTLPTCFRQPTLCKEIRLRGKFFTEHSSRVHGADTARSHLASIVSPLRIIVQRNFLDRRSSSMHRIPLAASIFLLASLAFAADPVPAGVATANQRAGHPGTV